MVYMASIASWVHEVLSALDETLGPASTSSAGVFIYLLFIYLFMYLFIYLFIYCWGGSCHL